MATATAGRWLHRCVLAMVGTATVVLLVVGSRAAGDPRALEVTVPGVVPSTSVATSTSPTPTLTAASTAGAPVDEAPEALPMFETDQYNRAVACFRGQTKPAGHTDRFCRLTRSRKLVVDSSYGAADVVLFGGRSTWEADAGYGVTEEVVLVDSEQRPAQTLVQWRSSVYDGQTTTLRRRFLFANADGAGERELCVESETTEGPGLFELQKTTRYRPTTRHVGYDAFFWNGTRFARAESLDAGCPRTGYRLFVNLPLTDDIVHRSRGL